MYIGLGAFSGKVSDKLYAGTWMTMSNSFQNLGIVWANTAVIYSMNYFSSEILFGFGVVYSIMFYKSMKKKVVRLDMVNEDKFRISNF